MLAGQCTARVLTLRVLEGQCTARVLTLRVLMVRNIYCIQVLHEECIFSAFCVSLEIIIFFPTEAGEERWAEPRTVQQQPLNRVVGLNRSTQPAAGLTHPRRAPQQQQTPPTSAQEEFCQMMCVTYVAGACLGPVCYCKEK